MAFDGHWRKVGTAVGVYLAGLVGVQQYFYWQEEPEQTEFRKQRKSDDAKRWDDAKEAVREECTSLGSTSLHCQNALQGRGVDKATALAQCQGTIDAFKECNNRKSQIESRRGWWEVRQKELQLRQQQKQQQRGTAAT